MKYQLVLPLPFSSETGRKLLIELESTVTEGLPDPGIVDLCSGEMNILIHTDLPKPAFERDLLHIQGQNGLLERTAGDRDFDKDDYVAIYPVGREAFSAA